LWRSRIARLQSADAAPALHQIFDHRDFPRLSGAVRMASALLKRSDEVYSEENTNVDFDSVDVGRADGNPSRRNSADRGLVYLGFPLPNLKATRTTARRAARAGNAVRIGTRGPVKAERDGRARRRRIAKWNT
jgi:hypothetical protein